MGSSPGVGHWSAILVLVLFVVSNAAVIYPLCVPIPKAVQESIYRVLVALHIAPRASQPLRRVYAHLNFVTVPLFSVLLLLAAGAIDGTVVRDGIVGADGVKPLNIMALFISLAYLSISLDSTGLFRSLALWVVRKGGSSGPRLFLYLYLLFLLCGVLVGNDPVILSGTAFLAYLTRVSGITPPTAWIFSQFAAANMASVVLVSSNPTNLVLSGAFSLSFIRYTANCILPFLAAAVAVYPILVLLFRSPHLIPASIDISFEDNADLGATLVDKTGAVFGSILVLITLGVLIGVSAIGVPAWEVTVPPAVIMLARDIHHDWRLHRLAKARQSYTTSPPQPKPGFNESAIQPEMERVPSTERLPQAKAHPTSLMLVSSITHYMCIISRTFPTVSNIVQRLPFPLLPFAFLMFILVQGLASQGWVEIFASWWTAWISETGYLGAIGGMGFLSCMACNVCGTNIGATILLARVIQLWLTKSSIDVDPRAQDGAIYALALGSNYGAFTVTFSASLAGLLWRRILRQKGIHVRATQFLLLNLPIAFTAMLVSSLILVAQVNVIHRHRIQSKLQ